MDDKMNLWNSVCRPPPEALKPIKGGRLAGMTDISPQWRYQVMTEVFGPVGKGWKWKVVRLWSEPGAEGVIFAFAHIEITYEVEKGWYSEPIPGVGGSTLVAKESKGLYSSDEGYKMAITDALSAALKLLGVGADVYAGKWDGSKYKDAPSPKQEAAQEPPTSDTPTSADDMIQTPVQLHAGLVSNKKYIDFKTEYCKKVLKRDGVPGDIPAMHKWCENEVKGNLKTMHSWTKEVVTKCRLALKAIGE